LLIDSEKAAAFDLPFLWLNWDESMVAQALPLKLFHSLLDSMLQTDAATSPSPLNQELSEAEQLVELVKGV
jgi:hypothetical protein